MSGISILSKHLLADLNIVKRRRNKLLEDNYYLNCQLCSLHRIELDCNRITFITSDNTYLSFCYKIHNKIIISARTVPTTRYILVFVLLHIFLTN